MRQQGPKHVGVYVLQHYCNSNRVCTLKYYCNSNKVCAFVGHILTVLTVLVLWEDSDGYLPTFF